MINAARVDEVLSYPALIDVLDAGFRSGAVSPLRHHHQINRSAVDEATLLLMPAWTRAAPLKPGEVPADTDVAGAFAGVKLVTVTPDNGVRHALPAIAALYLLISTDTGLPLALIDGAKLTVWRTAGASGLASRYLSRTDSRHLAMVGAGALAPFLIRAHASVRPIDRVTIWNRSAANAEAVADQFKTSPIEVVVSDDLEQTCRAADIISTATISHDPLVRGDWLKPGQHVDCVGAFRPIMRETDDAVVRRARIWVDTLAGGLHEAGDIVIPLKAGVISEADIQGDLFGLAAGTAPVRTSDDEITMFKSVGASIEDLFAAISVFDRDAANPSEAAA